MTKNNSLCNSYDLSSVKSIFTGAAPLGSETANELQKQYPGWMIRQGYGTLHAFIHRLSRLYPITGLTETCTVVCSTAEHDIWFGSSGSLLPSFEARIISAEGKEITSYGQAGELLIRSPTVVLGYLNNDSANKETFQDGWVRTGDEALNQKKPEGY